jgi:hypothetical protein
MTKEQGQKQGLIPIKDFLPEEELCYKCGKFNCDRFDVKGFSHNKCNG